jgi:hypothetical protein
VVAVVESAVWWVGIIALAREIEVPSYAWGKQG